MGARHLIGNLGEPLRAWEFRSWRSVNSRSDLILWVYPMVGFTLRFAELAA
jgi:hypothetical protein